MTKVKKTPTRLCIGCQTPRPKKELLRIVRSPEGEIFADPTGKKSGRGAYICPRPECFDTAVKAHRFAKAFKEKVAEKDLDEVRQILFGGREKPPGGEP